MDFNKILLNFSRILKDSNKITIDFKCILINLNGYLMAFNRIFINYNRMWAGIASIVHCSYHHQRVL